jgi:hypothetical protein
VRDRGISWKSQETDHANPKEMSLNSGIVWGTRHTVQKLYVRECVCVCECVCVHKHLGRMDVHHNHATSQMLCSVHGPALKTHPHGSLFTSQSVTREDALLS